MKICFTTMNEMSIFNVLDIDNGEIEYIPNTVTVNDHRPFGITWDRGRILIAQPTSVLSFDKSWKNPSIALHSLWYGIHQALFYDNVLWMVSPRLNAVKRFSLNEAGEFKYFFPDEGRVSTLLPQSFYDKSKLNYTGGDISHYNSIFIKEDRLYLAAHNHDKPSFLSVFKYPELRLVCRYEGMGRQIHNICVEGDEIWTLDSLGSRSVVSTKGRSIPIGKDGQFLRGLAATPEIFVLGCFSYDPTKRHRRRGGNSWIVVVDRKKCREVKRIAVRNMGNINDIRILDEPDLCHGIEPFIGGETKIPSPI